MVANFGDLSLSALDTLTGSVLNNFSVATDTFGVAVTLGGAFAYVTDFSDNGLSLDPDTGEISGNSNPTGTEVVNLCEFIIRVTDNATVPQTIQGTFRLIITED